MRAHELGKRGEAFALDYVRGLGYDILQLNYRVKCGEIDIVAKDGPCVVFIEVKTRVEEGWDPFEAVDQRRQRRMAMAATLFLLERFDTDAIDGRFDVIAVRAPADDGPLTAEHLKDAFSIS